MTPTTKAHRHTTPRTDAFTQIILSSLIAWVLFLDKRMVLTSGNMGSALSLAGLWLCLDLDRCSYQYSHEGAPRVHSVSFHFGELISFSVYTSLYLPFLVLCTELCWPNLNFFPVSPAQSFLSSSCETTETRPSPAEQCTLHNWIYQVLINPCMAPT